MNTKEIFQAHVFYSGTVQGVGFRYTVLWLATDLGLCGWVKNLRDGRVELTVEGPQEKIDRLLKKIEEHFGGYIKAKEIDFSPSSGQFDRFQITY